MESSFKCTSQKRGKTDLVDFFRNCTEFAADHRYPHLKAFPDFEFTITMSGTSPHRLATSLRRLGGRQNRSESRPPDVSTSPEQLEGEHGVRFVTMAVHLYSLTAFQHSQTSLAQQKRGIRDKFKELFTSKSKSQSQSHSPHAHVPAENIHPPEVCTDCI